MRTLAYLAVLIGISYPAVCAGNGTASTPITILVSFDQPHAGTSLKNLQSKLDGILDGAAIQVEIRDRNDVLAGDEFGQLVLFRMKGSCSMESLPIGALSDERGPLAMAYSTDGEILPFAEVRCDNIRASLERVLGKQNTRAYQPAFDSALGIVMAHEIYHILGKTAEHTRKGFTKAGLTSRELLDDKLSLPEIARLAIRENASSLK